MGTAVGISQSATDPGVLGESSQFEGVRGISHAAGHGGVVGINDNPSDNAGPGLYGESTKGEAVRGVGHSPVHGAVVGTCDNAAPGVFGESAKGEGVRGVSHSAVHGGVVGTCDSEAAGVYGESTAGEGVRGVSHSAAHGGVVGTNDHPEGIGIFGKGGRLAGRFEGDIEVTGDVRLTGADCAEDFDVTGADTIDAGTVVVLSQDGRLRQSDRAYDKSVVGVVSGAGRFRPGIVLDKRPSQENRRPIALVGKVYCKVDAQYGAIGVGDLLTTSPTAGHAMKACDPLSAFGSVIGKALGPLPDGTGLIPVLIALQ